MKKNFYRYHHLGIPTTVPVNGEVYLKDYKLFHAGYEQSEFGIEWMRYGEGVLVAFIEENGAPVEFIQVAERKKPKRKQ